MEGEKRAEASSALLDTNSVLGPGHGGQRSNSGYGRKGPQVREATAIQKGARRVLLAAIAEAGGVSHVYVYRERVMEQANVPDMEAFWEIADYLARRGYITEGNPDYWTFSVTPRGIAEAAK